MDYSNHLRVAYLITVVSFGGRGDKNMPPRLGRLNTAPAQLHSHSRDGTPFDCTQAVAVFSYGKQLCFLRRLWLLGLCSPFTHLGDCGSDQKLPLWLTDRYSPEVL